MEDEDVDIGSYDYERPTSPLDGATSTSPRTKREQISILLLFDLVDF